MAQDMTELLAALKESSKPAKTKIAVTAKSITLVILVVSFGFGVYGSFEKAIFNMADYVTFLETFTWFFAPLIISIGAGSATKSLTDLKKKKEETKV